MTWRNVKRSLAALAFMGVPLVVSGSCDRYGGVSFFRDDDAYDYGFFDPWVVDEYWYDPYYYDTYYYDEVIFLP